MLWGVLPRTCIQMLHGRCGLREQLEDTVHQYCVYCVCVIIPVLCATSAFCLAIVQ